MAYVDSGYTLSQGRVFLAERTRNGLLTGGLDWIGDADSVQITFTQKTQTVSDQFSGRGYTTHDPVVETSVALKINALDTRLANWARATWGTSSGAVAGGTVLTEAVTLTRGRYVKLAHMAVSGVTVAGAVDGADFVVDSAAHGLLRVLSDAPVAASPFVTTAAYDYAATTGKVEALTVAQKFYKVVVAGVNVAQGNQPTVLTVHQVTLEMGRSVDAISKRPVAFELNGTVLVDSSITTAGLSQFFIVEKA